MGERAGKGQIVLSTEIFVQNQLIALHPMLVVVDAFCLP